MKAKVQLSCKWYQNWDAHWLRQKSLNLYFSLYGRGREMVPSKWILSIRFALCIQPKGVDSQSQLHVYSQSQLHVVLAVNESFQNMEFQDVTVYFTRDFPLYLTTC